MADEFRHGELIAVMSKDQNSRELNGKLKNPTKMYVYAVGQFEDGDAEFFSISWGAAEVLASDQFKMVSDQVRWVAINLSDNPGAVNPHRNWQVFFQLPKVNHAR